MIRVIVNGEEIMFEKDMTIFEFLNFKGFDLRFVAVERDCEILPQNSWKVSMMSEGKSYEIVQFVGGG